MIQLADADWECICHLFPEENISPGRAGRKSILTRRVFEAVLRVLNVGAQWHKHP